MSIIPRCKCRCGIVFKNRVRQGCGVGVGVRVGVRVGVDGVVGF